MFLLLQLQPALMNIQSSDFFEIFYLKERRELLENSPVLTITLLDLVCELLRPREEAKGRSLCTRSTIKRGLRMTYTVLSFWKNCASQFSLLKSKKSVSFDDPVLHQIGSLAIKWDVLIRLSFHCAQLEYLRNRKVNPTHFVDKLLENESNHPWLSDREEFLKHMTFTLDQITPMDVDDSADDSQSEVSFHSPCTCGCCNSCAEFVLTSVCVCLFLLICAG